MKTDRRLDKFEQDLKQVEADTYWKIKDYEKLLEARPTLQYVRSAMEEEGRSVLIKSRVYTDEELLKLKSKALANERSIESFKLAFNGDLRDMQATLTAHDDKMKAQSKSLKAYTNRVEL